MNLSLGGTPECTLTRMEDGSFEAVWPLEDGFLVYALIEACEEAEKAFSNIPMEHHDIDPCGNPTYEVLCGRSRFGEVIKSLVETGHGDGPMPFGSLIGMYF